MSFRKAEKLNIKIKNSSSPLIWMRDETKPGEKRCPIIPKHCLRLIKAGFEVVVERSNNRCILDEKFEKVGCKLVNSQSWIDKAPSWAFILGLKNLPDKKPKTFQHRHIFFSHSFKGQLEAIPLLKKFVEGNGEILDLEYLFDNNGKRIATFGKAAGMVGMALAIIVWCKQTLIEKLEIVKPFESEKSMIKECKTLLKKCIPLSVNKKLPSIIIIGASGRCGLGALHIAKNCGITDITEWGSKNTENGGPFKEIVSNHEIFVNCINLKKSIKPFITLEMCKSNNRRLTVISDVSCDPNNINNPISVYNKITTLNNPVQRIIINKKQPLDIIAIDHLPTLLPLESSQLYSKKLIQTLIELKDSKSPIWQRVKQSYHQALKINNLKQENGTNQIFQL